MEKIKRIWNETDRFKVDLKEGKLRTDFMLNTEIQDAYADGFYNWFSTCRGGCGHKVHIGEFMDKEKGVCPKCGTKHETFMPLFPQQTMGRVVFKKKVNKFGSV